MRHGETFCYSRALCRPRQSSFCQAHLLKPLVTDFSIANDRRRWTPSYLTRFFLALKLTDWVCGDRRRRIDFQVSSRGHFECTSGSRCSSVALLSF